MKSCSVTFQMKPLEKHFHKILLVFQYFDKVKAEFFVEIDFHDFWGLKG